MILLLIGISSFLTVLGQVFFKLGMQRFSNEHFSLNVKDMLPLFGQIMFNPFILFGFIFFGLGAIFWLIVLSKEELSYAVPAAAMSYVIIVFLGKVIFHEPLTLGKMGGVLLISLGIYILK